MRDMLMRIAAAACLVGAACGAATKAEARCQGCFEGPMTLDTVPYYASAYYGPRYYHPYRRYIRYSRFYRGYYAPQYYYYVRPYVARHYW